MVELAAVLTAAVISGPATAQTPTPTLTPPPTCTPRSAPAACSGANKVSVSWKAKAPTVVGVTLSAAHCPIVPSCGSGADGDLVSVPPVTVILTDSAGHSLTKKITDPGVNSGGCPGGIDSYRGADRFRLIFGAAMTMIGKLRFSQTQSTAPALTPPLTVTAQDACGTLATATVGTCFPKPSTIGSVLKCSQ